MGRAIGVDLGGTKIAAGVVDARGKILRHETVPYRVGDADAVVERFRELVSSLDVHDPVGVGIGAAGLIDFANGRYLYGPNTGLPTFDLADRLSKVLGLPVRLDNDANCAAWAEHRFGSGRGTRHFLAVTLGTGIGGGIVIDGKPYRGAHGVAGEIGHMLVDPEGPVCGCGRRGCWEVLASGLALTRTVREELILEQASALWERTGGDPTKVDGPMVTECARAGDPFARRSVDRLATWVGWGLASLVNILEPERIAIGGGLARDWDLLAERAITAMTERAEAPEHRTLPDVVAAELGPEAGIVGAALLVLDGEGGLYGDTP